MRHRTLAVLAALLLALAVLPAMASSASAAAKKPARTAGVELTSGKGHYVATWKAPAARGAKIKRYQVATRHQKKNAKKWTKWKTRTVKKRSVRVKGKTGAKHQFRVRAKNKKGYGKWSKRSTVRIGLPGVPKRVQLTEGMNKVAVSWNAAAARGAKIKSYRVQVRHRSGSGWSKWSTTKASASARSVTITGEASSRTHQARVQAVNKVGKGERSKPVGEVQARASVTGTAPYSGGETVTVKYAGFPYGETTLNVAVCANDGRPLSGPDDCAPFGASNKLVTAVNGAGTTTLSVPDGALGNVNAPALTCDETKKCAIVVTTITSNFFFAGPFVLDYANATASMTDGPYVAGQQVTVDFSGFPGKETTINVAVCANDGRMLSGPDDCAPLMGPSNQLVTPSGGAGSATLTLPTELGNVNGPAITCGPPDSCAVVVTTITSDFHLAGPLPFSYEPV